MLAGSLNIEKLRGAKVPISQEEGTTGASAAASLGTMDPAQVSPFTTYLSGDGIFFSGVSFLAFSLSLLFMFGAEQFDAAEASVASEGSWIEALLPCRC
jgi:hypothetical protein